MTDPLTALVRQWRADAQRMRLEHKRYPEGRILAIEGCADDLEAVLAEAWEWRRVPAGYYDKDQS